MMMMGPRSFFLASAVAAAAILSGVSAQDARETQGQFKLLSDNSGVVAVHMGLLPDNKLFLSERFHEIPNQWRPLNPTDSGLVPNALYNGDAAHAAWAAQSPFYKPNKNLGTFLTDAAEYDIATNTFKMIQYRMDGDQGYAFCNGASQMADGALLVAGGDSKYNWPIGINGANVTTDGRRDVRIYNNGNLTKVPTAQMPLMQPGNWKNFTGRWYPTAVTLPNEDVMILGGQKTYFDPGNPIADNPTYETYRTATRTLDPAVTVTALAQGFPINMYPIAYVLPKTGQVFMLAGNKSSILNWETKTETPFANLPEDNIYPRSFPFMGTNWMNPLSPANNYKTDVWVCGGTNRTTLSDYESIHGKGTAPWYDNCSKCKATSRCYHIDPEQPGATWVAEEMPIARSQPMAINLPDGKIAIFGGSATGHQGGDAGIALASDPTNKVVLFNPQATDREERWVIGAEAQVDRLYHSSSVLLPDGSIIIAGSDNQNYKNIRDDPYEYRIELYLPPYMFMANRPALDLATAPKTLRYGQEFLVPLAGDYGGSILNVSMIRYGTSTHTLNIDQRHVELEILKYGKNKLLVRSPPNANVAPPGNWMLWAVTNRGAPVQQAATVNMRATNPGENAVWNEADTIERDPLPVKPKKSGNKGSGAASTFNRGLLGVVGSVVVGGIIAALL